MDGCLGDICVEFWFFVGPASHGNWFYFIKNEGHGFGANSWSRLCLIPIGGIFQMFFYHAWWSWIFKVCMMMVGILLAICSLFCSLRRLIFGIL